MWMWRDAALPDVVSVASRGRWAVCNLKGSKTLLSRRSTSLKVVFGPFRVASAHTKYYTSSLAGRCSAGQRIKVVVNACAV
jgi:hypothetical protein